MKRNFKGYTLIELLVGLSIIGIIFSVGLAGYREFSRRQALTGVSKQLKADLRLAQQLALTGQKPDGVACDTLTGYTFNVSVSTSSYSISANCTSTLNIKTSPEIKNVSLGTDIQIVSTTAAFQFKGLGQGTNLTSSNTITLTHISGNTSLILVGIGGDVK
jgi:prepilin-type N-terminal cleavage/methylation domain-containing protein